MTTPSLAQGKHDPSSEGVAQPTRVRQIANLVVFQSAWFAAVLGAAHHAPLLGTACVIGAIGWHVAISKRPGQEAMLVALACALGLVVETFTALQGNVSYPSGQPVSGLAPYWLVALWGLLAISLNVTLRWLRARWWLTAGLAAVAGPASFVSGVRLGGAQFIDMTSALVTLACIWALAMPLLVRLSMRFDGVATGTRHA
ncbi:DUF2878 domain-containing protein [Variovorax sp. J22R133]|uniref:DUF2878 domain-containing protein n=1 Tax=Variovorax brevis TaxID=3053503 RepID=UPI0025790EEE|nr:DUF2878 domain-containing protein [Variovorax sp. J22R133]MDM0111142.1 DUF2878 domain-containing protein [Variovorax sp. J22R133]